MTIYVEKTQQTFEAVQLKRAGDMWEVATTDPQWFVKAWVLPLTHVGALTQAFKHKVILTTNFGKVECTEGDWIVRSLDPRFPQPFRVDAEAFKENFTPSAVSEIIQIPPEKIDCAFIETLIESYIFKRIPQTRSVLCIVEMKNHVILTADHQDLSSVEFDEKAVQELAYHKALQKAVEMEKYHQMSLAVRKELLEIYSTANNPRVSIDSDDAR